MGLQISCLDQQAFSGNSLAAQQVKDLALSVLCRQFNPRPKNVHMSQV